MNEAGSYNPKKINTGTEKHSLNCCISLDSLSSETHSKFLWYPYYGTSKIPKLPSLTASAASYFAQHPCNAPSVLLLVQQGTVLLGTLLPLFNVAMTWNAFSNPLTPVPSLTLCLRWGPFPYLNSAKLLYLIWRSLASAYLSWLGGKLMIALWHHFSVLYISNVCWQVHFFQECILIEIRAYVYYYIQSFF